MARKLVWGNTRLLCVLLLALTAGQSGAAIPADYLQGVALSNAGDYAGAIMLFQRIASANPQWAAKAYQRMGVCYERQMRHDLAIPAFERALSLNIPVDAKMAQNAKQELAACYAETKALGNAIPFIQEMFLASPQMACRLLCHGCVKMREYERAAAVLIYSLVDIADVEHLGRTGLPPWLLSPANAQVHPFVQDACAKIVDGSLATTDELTRADLLAMFEVCGYTDAAIAVVTQTLSPNDTAADRASKIDRIASIEFRAGRYQDSVQHLTEALSPDTAMPQSAQAGAKLMLALCYMRLGDAATARSKFADLIGEHPGSAGAERAAKYLQTLGAAAGAGSKIGGQ